ncbi:MAG: hypothetical protein OHK0026_12180 [Rhodocyclaceae bacterium]
MSNRQPLQEPSLPQWMRTLAEVTVMDADRLQPMCIETAEPPRTRELARTRDKFRIKLAGSHDARRDTSVLIEKMYAWRGYAGVGAPEAAPNRITLNAEYNGSIYGTLTVNIDSPIGLACEQVFPEVVQALRGEGRKLCEFGRFAVEHSVRSKRLLATLFHMIYLYAHRLHGCTDALIEVNPRHVEFYRRYLEFEPCAPERWCPRVDAPAVLLRVDFAAKEPRMRALAGRWRSLPGEKSFYKYFMPGNYEAAVLARLAQRPDKEVYAA